MYVYVFFLKKSVIYIILMRLKQKIEFKPNKYSSVENMDLISVGLIKWELYKNEQLMQNKGLYIMQ